MEWLESRAVRPRQARYQAALRPDSCSAVLILLHFCTFIHWLRADSTRAVLNGSQISVTAGNHQLSKTLKARSDPTVELLEMDLRASKAGRSST